MSGSPKYTTVSLEAARQAQLAAARREREAERRRREEAERQRRLQVASRAALQRVEGVTGQLADLSRRAVSLPQHDEVERVRSAVAAVPGRIRQATDEAEVRQATKAVRDAERSADRLAGQVARELTHREHDGALAVLTSQLDTVAGRDVQDPVGHRSVQTLTGAARSRLGGAGFAAAHADLATAVATHLDKVRERQATMVRLAMESDAATARVTAVLAEADQAGVEVPDRDRLQERVAELRTELDGHHVTRWEHRIGELRRTAEEVGAAVDARLDQLDRMAIIIEAASEALPAAGLRVVPESLRTGGASTTFAAVRADGTSIEVTVHPGDGRGTRVEYRSDADDTVVIDTGDGETRTCDLTEELLERFHEQLAEQGLRTDGLHWQGKPDRPRPPDTAARQIAVPGDRSRP